jgi:flagellar biosynthetic protein FlhB
MADEFQEKTEQATPRRREKAREEGQIPRSKDLVSMGVLGGIILIFYLGGEYFFTRLAELTGGILSFRYGTEPGHVANIAILESGLLLAPFFLVSTTMGVVGNLMQGGFVVKPFKVQIEKINPVEGIKNLFSTKGLIELLKAILKVGIGCWIVYFIIDRDLRVFPTLSVMEIGGIARTSGGLIMNAVLIAYCYFLVISVFSALLEKWQFEKGLRMTKQEIKEEHKDIDGDPLIKSRIRSIQRDTARKRMMQEVERSTVVITNPTHLAVALKYEDKGMHAPKIVAKGAGIIAEKIKTVAAEHGIPIVEDKPLARSLFKLDLNTFIPEELYVAVAKILVYIYKIKGKI